MDKRASAQVTVWGFTAAAVCLFAGWANGHRAVVTVQPPHVARTCTLTTTYEDGHAFVVEWDDPHECDRIVSRSAPARR